MIYDISTRFNKVNYYSLSSQCTTKYTLARTKLSCSQQKSHATIEWGFWDSEEGSANYIISTNCGVFGNQMRFITTNQDLLLTNLPRGRTIVIIKLQIINCLSCDNCIHIYLKLKSKGKRQSDYYSRISINTMCFLCYCNENM